MKKRFPGFAGQSFERVDTLFDRSVNLELKSMIQQFLCERVETSLSKQHGVNSFKDDDVISLLLTGKRLEQSSAPIYIAAGHAGRTLVHHL